MISDEFRSMQCNILYLGLQNNIDGGKTGKSRNLKGKLVFGAVERFKRYQQYLMWMKCIKYKFSHLQYQPSLHCAPALWNNRDRKAKKTTTTTTNLRRIKCCTRKSNKNQRNEKQKKSVHTRELTEFVIQKTVPRAFVSFVLIEQAFNAHAQNIHLKIPTILNIVYILWNHNTNLISLSAARASLLYFYIS